MNIIEFIEKYPTEESCKSDFKIQREFEGVKCKNCGSGRHYWLKSKWQWKCQICTFRTTLRSGTVMENSKLPLRKWYLAMALMTFSKKGISACEMQRQLDHKRYEPIWLMMHKIRKAMGKRDELYTLNSSVEFNEGYFEKAIPYSVKLKRGRGSQRQVNVAVMAQSVPLEELETGHKSKHVSYFKMKVLSNHKANSINQCIADNIDDKAIVFSDKSKSYVDINDYVEIHVSEKSTPQTTKTSLHWVHIAISNAKRTLLGIYHKIKGKYLQSYLDEFCYKLNRRYFGNRLFERLALALAKSYW